MLGMEWDLTLISKEFAELVEQEVTRYLDWYATERNRGEYSILKAEVFSYLPMESRGYMLAAATNVKIGIGRKGYIRQFMEFTYHFDTGNSRMHSSIDLSDARDAIDFARS